jgi:hypothetical protein
MAERLLGQRLLTVSYSARDTPGTMSTRLVNIMGPKEISEFHGEYETRPR